LTPVGLYQRILGHPFVYERIRPLVVGGIDMSAVYARLGAGPKDVILDIGCGMGNALRYLSSFESYLGLDTDEVAIRRARDVHGIRRGVSFACRLCRKEDMEQLKPTHLVMAGLLHHLSDNEALHLLSLAARSPRLVRIVTQDIVYLPGPDHGFNNVLAWLDRGRHCRRPEEYRKLVTSAGLNLVDEFFIRSGPDSSRDKYFVKYFVMAIEPRSPAATAKEEV
jgi:SAM-dependent methyltransferase